MLLLKGACFFDANVSGLFLAELGQLASYFLEMEASHFLVNVLGKDIDTWSVFLHLLPEFNLGERLIGEAVRHDE